jgi:hypothetical protein
MGLDHLSAPLIAVSSLPCGASAASKELGGGVAQVRKTASKAQQLISREFLTRIYDDGTPTGVELSTYPAPLGARRYSLFTIAVTVCLTGSGACTGLLLGGRMVAVGASLAGLGVGIGCSFTAAVRWLPSRPSLLTGTVV